MPNMDINGTSYEVRNARTYSKNKDHVIHNETNTTAVVDLETGERLDSILNRLNVEVDVGNVAESHLRDTNFKIDSMKLSEKLKMSDLIFDSLVDLGSMDSTKGDYETVSSLLFDPAYRMIRTDGADVTLYTLPIKISYVPAKAVMMVDVVIKQPESSYTFYISTDGTLWTEVSESVTNIQSISNANTVYLKIELKGHVDLYNYAVALA